jgi:hypothetical protein
LADLRRSIDNRDPLDRITDVSDYGPPTIKEKTYSIRITKETITGIRKWFKKKFRGKS